MTDTHRHDSTVQTPCGRALRIPPPLCAIAFVPSSTRTGLRHAVMRHVDDAGGETWACSCEGGSFRPEKECRHVRAVRGLHLPQETQLTPEGCVVLGVLGDTMPDIFERPATRASRGSARPAH